MKKIMVLIFVLGLQVNAFSQLHPYNWRLGIGGGYANYYGDLSPFTISSIKDYGNFARLYDFNKNYILDYSYAVSLERRLGPTIGLLISTGKYTISMSDRYMDKQNVLLLEATNFERALNFKTDIRDYGLGLVFRMDNGKIINKNAFLAPFFQLGVGWLNFKVYGDLYDDKGDPYNYASDESINDGVFETRLDKLNTELPEGYPDNSFYSTLGVGIRFRLTKQLELFVKSDFKRAATDYLDDVSGEYRLQYESPEQFYAAKPGNSSIDWENPDRGNRNGQNDWFIYHSIGIKLSFMSNKTAFRASRISPGILTKVEEGAPEDRIEEEVNPEFPDSISSSGKEPVVTNNYITFIQMHRASEWDSSYNSLSLINSSKKDSIVFFNEILQLPDALKKALSNPQSIYYEKRDRGHHLLSPSPGWMAVKPTDSTENIFSPSTPSDILKYQNQMDRLRSDLMQERARSYFLLQHLNGYGENPSLPLFDQNLSDREKSQNASLRRNNSPQPMFYSYPYNADIPRENRFGRRNNDSEYLIPLMAPEKNGSSSLSRPLFSNSPHRAASPGLEEKRIIPGPKEISAGFSGLRKEKVSSYFPQVTKRIPPNTAGTPVERIPDLEDTVSNTPSHLLITNKQEIYFEVNQATPGDQEIKKLLPIAHSLKNNPDWRIIISGFADNTGNLRYNLNLINERISNVRKFFVEESGISPERITILSGGLIIRGNGQKSSPMDRKVEVWIQEND